MPRRREGPDSRGRARPRVAVLSGWLTGVELVPVRDVAVFRRDRLGRAGGGTVAFDRREAKV